MIGERLQNCRQPPVLPHPDDLYREISPYATVQVECQGVQGAPHPGYGCREAPYQPLQAGHTMYSHLNNMQTFKLGAEGCPEENIYAQVLQPSQGQEDREVEKILYLHRPITDSEEYQEPAKLVGSFPSPPSEYRGPPVCPQYGGVMAPDCPQYGGVMGRVLTPHRPGTWDPFDHPPKVRSSVGGSGPVLMAQEAETVFR